jgi:NADPH:quinone reductase
MKALVYERAHDLADFTLELAEVSEPTVRKQDVLVEVRAIGVNPGEAFIRRLRSAEPGGRVLLGWEFAGVVTAVGDDVQRFTVGERVFGTGDTTREGSWADRLAVEWVVSNRPIISAISVSSSAADRCAGRRRAGWVGHAAQSGFQRAASAVDST